MRTPAIVTALGGVLPNTSETTLLRACLLNGEFGLAAWETWSRASGDLKTAVAEDKDGIKRLAPLLYGNLRANNATIHASVLPYLRAIFAREQMRTRTYLRICEQVLGVLDEAGVPVIVLRGAAAAITVYDDPALRHCHDLSLLLPPQDMTRAVDAMCRHGLDVSMDRQPTSSWRDVLLRHESTLPIELHSRLFEESLYDLPYDLVQQRASEARVGDRTVMVLAPTDALLHLTGHASYSPSRRTMRWLCDAWHILRNTPDLDWELLVDTGQRAHLALPLAVSLGYMAEELGANVPRSAQRRLLDAVDMVDAFERDIALRGARTTASESGWERLRRVPGGWQVRLRVLGWLVFPSVRYVRESSGAHGGAGAVMHYLLRLTRFASAGVRAATG